MVFQDHKLLADRPVFDNVALPLAVAARRSRRSTSACAPRSTRWACWARSALLPQELSVGEQQRVGIARAVVSKPPLLIADEPTGNLDPDLSLEVMRLFRRFSDVGVTVVIATHDMHLVREFGAARHRARERPGAGDARPTRCPAWWHAMSRHLQACWARSGAWRAARWRRSSRVFVIALALALPAALKVFVSNSQAATGNFASAVDLSVYLKTDVPLAKAQQLAQAAQQRRDVAEVTLIPADKGLEDFRTYSGFGDALAALKENPLPHVLHVRPQGPGRLRRRRSRRCGATSRHGPRSTSVQVDAEWVIRFNAMLDVLRRLLVHRRGAARASGVLAVIGNTIRLEIRGGARRSRSRSSWAARTPTCAGRSSTPGCCTA